MGISYIPGNEQLLAPAFEKIAEGVANVLQPNKRFQDAVLGAIVQNPGLIQEFANFEASAPGTLNKLGIGGLAAVPPSPDAEFQAKNRGKIVAGKEGALEAETLKNNLDAERIRGAFKLLSSPDADGVARDAALKLITGQTQDERTISAERAKQAPIETEAMRTETDLKAQQAALASKGLAAAQRILSEGPDVSLTKFMNGEYEPDELLAIASTPFWNVIQAQMNIYGDELRMRHQFRTENNALERQKYMAATELFLQLGRGSPQDAYQYMFGGGALKASQGQTLEGGQAEIAEGLRQITDQSRAAKALAANQRFLTALETFRRIPDLKNPDSEAEKRLAADGINAALMERAVFGAPVFSVTYEEVTKQRGLGRLLYGPSKVKELVFRDAKGNIVPVSQVVAATDKVPTGPADSDLQPYVDAYQAADSATKARLLSTWRGQSGTSSQFLVRLEAALGIK